MSGNIAPLAKEWLEAKQEEEYAKSRRYEIEKQLAAAMDVPAEGSKTHKVDGYKVTVTQPVYRKIDVEKWEDVKRRVSEDMHPVKVKLEADATGCKYLAEKEPDAWSMIADAFTTSPGKVSFKVEETR